MGINDGLDASRLAIGRLERALSRAEKAAQKLAILPEAAPAPTPAAHDLSALRVEIHSAIAEIDAILPARDGSRDHG